MDDWESDNWSPPDLTKPAEKKKWDDEDIFGDPPKSEALKLAVAPAPSAPKAAPAKAKPAAAKKKAAASTPAPAPKEPLDPAAEKRQREELQLKQDLESAVDLFSGVADPIETDELTNFRPTTEAEFNKFVTILTKKISPYQTSPHYTKFVNDLTKQLVNSMKVDDIQNLTKVLNLVVNDKIKNSKDKKKKSGGPVIATKKLNVDDEAAGGGGGGGFEDEFDGYM